jgi:hypothetical protein
MLARTGKRGEAHRWRLPPHVATSGGRPVQALDRLLGILGPFHLHEAESASPTRLSVGDHLGRGDRAVGYKQLLKIVLSHFEG